VPPLAQGGRARPPWQGSAQPAEHGRRASARRDQSPTVALHPIPARASEVLASDSVRSAERSLPSGVEDPSAIQPGSCEVTIRCADLFPPNQIDRHRSPSQMAKGKSSSAPAAAAAAVASKKPRASSASSTRMLTIIGIGALIAFCAGLAHDPSIVTRLRSSFSSSTSSSAASAAAPSSPRILSAGRYNLTCLDAYPRIGHCSPPSTCARILVDDFLTPEEVDSLLGMAHLGMSFGRGRGGPTIFDTISGAASKGEAFHDAYMLMTQAHQKAMETTDAGTLGSPVLSLEPIGPNPAEFIFTAEQLALYRRTTQRIKALAQSEFGVSGLYLTSPSFFSRIEPSSKKTSQVNDEYWHAHCDKKQYGSFMYTALIYLSTHSTDFTGGSFHFEDADGGVSQVLPRRGRMMVFTSGEENIHWVEKVQSGVRHALTIAFTCDRTKDVEGTLFKKADALLQKHTEWALKHSGGDREEMQVRHPELGAIS
jgi:hypothetical protein